MYFWSAAVTLETVLAFTNFQELAVAVISVELATKAFHL
jgi:hypothetical protein